MVSVRDGLCGGRHMASVALDTLAPSQPRVYMIYNKIALDKKRHSVPVAIF